jgi:hypothetical protein
VSRCTNCHREDCPTLESFFLDVNREAARKSCEAHAVDWRRRALAAEERLAKLREAVQEERAAGLSIPTPAGLIRFEQARVVVDALLADADSRAGETQGKTQGGRK